MFLAAAKRLNTPSKIKWTLINGAVHRQK
jgi:hypothetical protein